MLRDEDLLQMHMEARTIKEHWWYQHQEPDMYPLMAVRWRDMQAQSVQIARVGAMMEEIQEFGRKSGMPTWLDDHEMTTPLVVFTTLAALRDYVHLPGINTMPARGTPIEMIMLAVEGYAFVSSDDDPISVEEAERVSQIGLDVDYKRNPASKVTERLTTYWVATSALGTAEWGRVTSAFVKDDFGHVVWDEPIINTSENFDLRHATTEGLQLDHDSGTDKLLDIMIPHVTRESLA
jgi:hypothetical protein